MSEANNGIRNSCTSTRQLPRDAEGGIKQPTSRFLSEAGGGGFCFDESTHDLAVTYTIQDSFSQFPTSVSLRQLVSQVSH